MQGSAGSAGKFRGAEYAPEDFRKSYSSAQRLSREIFQGVPGAEAIP